MRVHPMDTRSRLLLVAFVVATAAVAACESSTEIPGKVRYGGLLTGAKEVPATTSTATGQASMEVSSSGVLTYSVTWSGLTGAATGAHIHGPADSTQTAGVLIDFSALPIGSSQPTPNVMNATGSSSGTVNVKNTAVVTFTVSGDSLVKLLNAGLLYVNVHTDTNTTGEIRAQLKKK